MNGDKTLSLKNPTTVLVGTPAYGSMVHTDYLHSIMSYTNIPNLTISILTLGNESLITRARNKLFSIFLKSQFDYLLFLDADMGFNGNFLVNLINTKKDIIGAHVRLKDLERVVYNFGKVLDKSEFPLLKVDRLGTAVMLISKQAAQHIARYCDQHQLYYFNEPFYSRGDNIIEKEKIYDVFRVGVLDGEYLSEDYWFCKLAQKLGYDIYVDTRCITVHNGNIGLYSIPAFQESFYDDERSEKELEELLSLVKSKRQ